MCWNEASFSFVLSVYLIAAVSQQYAQKTRGSEIDGSPFKS